MEVEINDSCNKEMESMNMKPASFGCLGVGREGRVGSRVGQAVSEQKIRALLQTSCESSPYSTNV